MQLGLEYGYLEKSDHDDGKAKIPELKQRLTGLGIVVDYGASKAALRKLYDEKIWGRREEVKAVIQSWQPSAEGIINAGDEDARKSGSEDEDLIEASFGRNDFSSRYSLSSKSIQCSCAPQQDR